MLSIVVLVPWCERHLGSRIVGYYGNCELFLQEGSPGRNTLLNNIA